MTRPLLLRAARGYGRASGWLMLAVLIFALGFQLGEQFGGHWVIARVAERLAHE